MADLVEGIIEPDSFLAQLEDDSLEECVSLLNSRIYGQAGPHDLLGLVHVMFGVRPACIVSVRRSAISRSTAAAIAEAQDAIPTFDMVGQFLDAFDIPYVLTTKPTEGRAGNPAEAHLNYHVSFDQERLSSYAKVHAEETTDRRGLTRTEEEALGVFLGYPEPAIQAYCANEQMTHGSLLEELPDEELEESFGSFSDVFELLDVDSRAFVNVLLPYVVAATVPECLDRMVRDVARFLGSGLVAYTEYEITLLNQVIVDYRDRFAPAKDG